MITLVSIQVSHIIRDTEGNHTSALITLTSEL